MLILYNHCPKHLGLPPQALQTFTPMPKRKKPTSTLEMLIRSRSDLWQGVNAGKHQRLRIQSSLYPKLDAILSKNGWPLDHLCELYFPKAGIGELMLLMPALNALYNQHPHLTPTFINPPHTPYMPAFKMPHILHIRTRQHLWALEECLLSRTCLATLAWFEHPVTATQLRRLQLAAKQTGTWCILMHCTNQIQQRSPAGLRIALSPLPASQQKINVRILKKPLGWAGQSVDIDLTSVQNLAPHLTGTRSSQTTSLTPLVSPSTIPSTIDFNAEHQPP